MSKIILCIGVLGFAFTATGQTNRAQLPQTHIVYGPSTGITANELRHDARTNTLYARGQVRIETGSSTITADEADIHHLKDTRTAVDLAVDLRGNVRVVITPSAGK